MLEARSMKFDFKDFEVGTAENPAGPTGCTVFNFPRGAIAAIDVRGGAAAVREQSSIEEGNSWGWVDAIVLAGGSTYGLESASGVMRELLKQRDNSVHFSKIPSVPAAIVYDFSGRNNAIYPDITLGAQAFKNRRTNEVSVGAAGAGSFVTVGKFFGKKFSERSGQGAAFYESQGIKIFALTVVNAVGNIMAEDGTILAGSKDPESGKRLSIPDELIKASPSTLNDIYKGNTTISILITNANLDRGQLKRLAVMTHTGMARSIEPFHTPDDGDTLFVVSTYSKDVHGEQKSPDVSKLGTIAAKIMQNAVRNAIE